MIADNYEIVLNYVRNKISGKSRQYVGYIQYIKNR